jgi:hypothetical protein
MRVRFFPIWLAAVAMLAVCAGAGAGAAVGAEVGAAVGAETAATTRPAGAVDFLEYFLQSDDVDERWTIRGTDVRRARDPDGTSARTVILNKWSNPNCYEVFKITDAQIQIRYEVVRMGRSSGKDNWIRRYQEIDGPAPGERPGAVWMSRWVVPGAPGIVSRFRQHRWVFDENQRQYVIDPAGSAERIEVYASCVWADVTWPLGNETGFRIDRVLRLISQWQRDGLMVEMYDYARGKGLVGWRWLERISTLKPLKDDPTGKIFHCEEGLVYVEQQRGAKPPRVWRYDGAARSRELQVVPFQSHWKPELGKQWYVVYRDLSREQKLTKKFERVEHDFSLPEWGPGKTIADLK